MHAFSIFVFAPVSAQLSMLHMEKRSRNTLIVIDNNNNIIIIIITIIILGRCEIKSRICHF